MTDEGTPARWMDYMPLSALRPHPKNPRTHKPKDLRASFDRFGYTSPITIDERTGLMAAGHGRWELLKVMANDFAERPEGVEVDEFGEWLVPVNRGWTSKDDEDAEAYLIADNRQAELGGWDPPELAEALTPLTDSPLGLEGTGFTPRDLKGLLEPAKPTTGTENSYDQRADNYRNKQIRSIIFDYPLADFEFVTETAARARSTFKAETNAELFIAMLRSFEEAHPT
jgi:hypothetical protein